MKRFLLKIGQVSTAIIPFLVAVIPHPAFASLLGISIGGVLEDTLWQVTALFSELEMAIAGSLVTITGALLNATMTATLNMAAIVNETPAIGTAWTTVRDFGSVFIIFMLLYASIKIVLGVGSGIGQLIKNIVIAGLLINFSLFFTKVAVDASNIVSLSFYNAIAPTGLGQTGTTVQPSGSGAGSLVGLVSTAFDDGGLSNVFMQSLDLQAFANASSSAATLNQGDKYWNITLANSGAAVLMFFAAASFLAAALAFAVRIGVVILLMAFSPIYFIALIFPQLEQYAQKWTKMLYSMCIFMPVYLFLMYVAMSVLNDPHFFDFAKAGASSTNVTGGTIGSLIGPNLIGTVLQYIIAIFLINAPLAAAISIAGEGANFMQKMLTDVSKWGQGAIVGSQKWAVKNGWRETGSRAADALARNESFKNFAGKSLIGEYALKGTRNIAADFNKTKAERVKHKEEFAESLGFDEAKMASQQSYIRNLNAGIANAKARGIGTTALEQQLEQAKKDALNLELARKEAYVKRTEGGTDSFGGLYNRFVNKSNEVASSKVFISVKQKQMARAEEELKSAKEDLKQVKRDINNSGITANGQPPSATNPVIGNAAQQKKQTDLLNDIAKHTTTVTNIQNEIDQLKLIK